MEGVETIPYACIGALLQYLLMQEGKKTNGVIIGVAVN